MPDKLPNANVPNGEHSPGPWRGGGGGERAFAGGARGLAPGPPWFFSLSPPEGDMVRNLWVPPVEEEGCWGCHSLSHQSDIGLFR